MGSKGAEGIYTPFPSTESLAIPSGFTISPYGGSNEHSFQDDMGHTEGDKDGCCMERFRSLANVTDLSLLDLYKPATTPRRRLPSFQHNTSLDSIPQISSGNGTPNADGSLS